jgi:hypothetical protein
MTVNASTTAPSSPERAADVPDDDPIWPGHAGSLEDIEGLADEWNAATHTLAQYVADVVRGRGATATLELLAVGLTERADACHRGIHALTANARRAHDADLTAARTRPRRQQAARA